MPTNEERKQPSKQRIAREDPAEDMDGKPTISVKVHGNIGQRESPDEVKDDVREE